MAMIYSEAKRAEKLSHRRVYLDQSAFSDMLDAQGGWQRSELGQVLIAAREADKAVVWAGPTNVIETIQATDPARRRALASLILDLIDAKRMWWGHEFEAVEDFFLFLTASAPDAVLFRQYFEHHGEVARQVWLGGLGLVAATGGTHLGVVVEALRRTKAINRLIHARFALDPGEWVDRMVAAVRELKTTAADPLADVEKMTNDEIEDEISRLAAGARKLDKVGLGKLNKHREQIAQAYGGIEIGQMLRGIFTLPMDIQLTFNIPHIVSRWPELQRKTGCESLPQDIRQASPEALAADPAIARTVIELAIRAAARRGLMTTFLGQQVILREMQRAMNDKDVPTGGLTFDADHAAALVRHEVFITHDEWLAASLKTLAGSIEKETAGHWRPAVVTNAKQLRAVLDKPRA